MTLFKLPLELVSLITEFLDVNSLFNLGRTCRCIREILQTELICRLALTKGAGFSYEAFEAQTSGDYAKGVRRLAKRRSAIREAEPFFVAVVALAEDFIYTNGVLCYTLNRESLRILDVHGSATQELVVDIGELLEQTVPSFNPDWQYQFRPIHCSDGVLSCLYRREAEGNVLNHLIIFHTKDLKILASHPIIDSRKLFVRNDQDYLIFGTKSAVGRDGSRRWALRQINLGTKEVSDELVLYKIIGSCIGRNVCFEIFDGYLYCLSNKDTRQPEYGRWNSFYHALRFPLKEATKEKCESAQKRDLWRRHVAKEGQVDNRWTSLQLTRGQNGELFIVECRREWLLTDGKSQRACYKKVLRFDPSDNNSLSTPPSDGPFSTSTPPDDESSSDEEDESSETESYVETRAPENIHVGDNGTNGTMLVLNECFVRFYHLFADAFVDLEYQDGSIRLRVRPKPETSAKTAINPINAGDPIPTKAEISSPGRSGQGSHHGIKLWPLESPSAEDTATAKLKNVLSPQDGFERIESAVDERSLVYAPIHPARGYRSRPLVLISFDPSIHLPGYSKLRFHDAEPGACSELPPSGGSGDASAMVANGPESQRAPPCAAGVSSMMDVASTVPSGNPPASMLPMPNGPWASMQEALYLRLSRTETPRGFDMSF
ncbi:hypothetical protein B0T10DRAFT_3038 [Thelonectria olida]|uniref:F-box domain-containing protein n=1 Tax=Thelonectria olida TaxID=1576542 RepID=A0A9P9ATC3_9HYPO|nr:hypothetical protein B0T10DRAFT_3038 [Thelonectria olida]